MQSPSSPFTSPLFARVLVAGALTLGLSACDKSGDDKGAAAATGAAASTAATGAAAATAATGAAAPTAATGAAAPTAATGAAAPTAATGAAAPTAATGAAAPTAGTGAAAATGKPDASGIGVPPTTKKKKAAGPKADLAAGKDLFMKKCKSCHGANGDGQTKIGKKEDIPSMQKLKAPTSKVVSVITNGIKDTKMKAYKSKLSAEEIANVAAFVKTL